jgi:HprK-related kinase B
MIDRTCQDCVDLLLHGHELREEVVTLTLGNWGAKIRSNSTKLLDRLSHYFDAYVTSKTRFDVEIIALERAAPEMDLPFTDWRREPGKSGRKDSYVDLVDGRIIRKVRTGMVFVQHPDWRVAAGPCLAFDNQVINFINAQYMNYLQQNDWLICHAAAISSDNHTIAIAGFSGGGKSTLMLKTMEQAHWQFLTNDRLFIRRRGSTVACRGIAKMPRINPGTLLNNARLRPVLSDTRIAELESLTEDSLWALEDKHDVMIAEHYGRDRIAQEANLVALLVLNWSRNTDRPTEITRVDLRERTDLLDAIMKSPGPFYQFADGRFLADTAPLDGGTVPRHTGWRRDTRGHRGGRFRSTVGTDA